ncbi:MAG TPA: FGGY family carbohydrate kinase [Acidimicrobiia bacterium]|nr:FGGY family carbohydrate kinase [Acidimicrobiia bacterium]
MNVLTLDLGTSATKAALWADTRLVALTRTPIATRHPGPDRAEQDPEDWWRAVVDACAELRVAAPDEYASLEMVSCAAARETFACFDAALHPLSPGILWSDSRAVDESRALGDPVAFRRRTGVALGPAACAAKIEWVRRHEPDRFRKSDWLLSPRDFVLARITGQVATDATLASRTGLYDLSGTLIEDEALSRKLPPVISSLGVQHLANGEELSLPAGAQAILGAGDRACEVLGIGATDGVPMVSWGTTANVSIPHPGPIDLLPAHAQVSRGAIDGFVIEAGLSAAGAAVEWLASLTGWSERNLMAAAADVPTGSGGLLAFPWLYGARAPWWRPDVHASFTGLTNAHGAAELARSIVEGVAVDVARCVELLCPDAVAMSLAGRGADEPLWRSVVAGMTGLPARRHRFDEAASVGARLLAGVAREESITVDALNPVLDHESAAPEISAAYAALRKQSDRAASRLMDSEL